MSETPGVTKNEGIQKLLEAEKEATKIVDEARQRKYYLNIYIFLWHTVQLTDHNLWIINALQCFT